MDDPRDPTTQTTSNSADEYSAAVTFCETAVDEWTRSGVDAAFVAPGSRSTPLVLALLNCDSIAVHIFHDERSASFAALGHALQTARPSIVACSSGTAATHFHAAVLEASASNVPLILCTADRPPELQQVGAPQTIDQNKLYGEAVRFFDQPGPADLSQAHWWRSWASRLVAEADGWSGRPGPVHVNLAFREPLLGTAGPLPKGRDDAPWHHATKPKATASDKEIERIAELAQTHSGLIVCGRGTSEPDAALELAERLGWPLLADHRSGARQPGRAVCHADLLLRDSEFANANQPEMVIRFGEIHASKALTQWLSACQPTIVSAPPDRRWIDPERLSSMVVPGEGLASSLLSKIPANAKAGQSLDTNGDLRQRWLRSDAIAAETIAEVLADQASLSEPAIARSVMADAPSGSTVVLSSSMPVRDVEWFAAARSDIVVLSNRGTNGIDGVTSTAIGAALAGAATTLLIGDVAFLHDSPALVALAGREIDLHIVVVDNDGGGIFSFLPQAVELPAVSFETLFGTPHGTDLAGLCAAHHIDSQPWPPSKRSKDAPGGLRVTIAKTQRTPNKEVHDQLVRQVGAALRRDGDCIS